MQTAQRIFFLLLMALGILVLPWSAVFGVLCYCAARFSWYFESLLLGFLLGILSGLPFGFFIILFSVLVMVSEKIKPFFQEGGFAGIAGKTFAVLAVWWTMSIAGLLAVDRTAGLYGITSFWVSGLYALFYGMVSVVTLLALHYVIAAAYERQALKF